ncbi:Major Facilitator Superfamily [Geosmithia morbida]|uniref:Major Facilitator Superfamily n=1 Tax=Geosmithia morbida TaxID=1094350 RepID=A0A9P4YWH4_9HYPO|nr:Major Facilitator Superfamily [Geosmithia morbida]KAF4123822.1 Major Facilitator Superfamily [Geosmithia morbida]
MGGGGLSKPWLANISSSLSYGMSFLVTIAGGPLINKIGIKWSCFIAAMAMPLRGSSLYVNSRYGVDWYLLFGNLIDGAASGFLYVAETTAMLSYPQPEQRGLGSLIGGAINFSKNRGASSAGGVAWSTYVIFISFECMGVICALLLSPTRKVARSDGSKILVPDRLSWKQEFRILWKAMQKKQVLGIIVPSFYSFFYGGTMGTYLSLHFSVRARALSSLIVRTCGGTLALLPPPDCRIYRLTSLSIAALTIPSVLAYGKILDGNWTSRKRHAQLCILLWVIPAAAAFIWIGIENHRVASQPALDYVTSSGSWARAYIPYLIIFVVGYWTQLSLYWILGNFSLDVGNTARMGGLFRAFETAGQAVSYGINSSSSIGGTTTLYVNCGLFVASLPFLWWLIHIMPPVPGMLETEGIDPKGHVIGDQEIGDPQGVDTKKH